MKTLVFLAAVLIVPVCAGQKSPAFGNATCIGHVPDNPSTPALRNKHCTFLTGDPARPDSLTMNTLPVGEPLLVLGRSAAMQGINHGSTWYLAKTRDNRQGYLPEYDLQCTATPTECDTISTKSLP